MIHCHRATTRRLSPPAPRQTPTFFTPEDRLPRSSYRRGSEALHIQFGERDGNDEAHEPDGSPAASHARIALPCSPDTAAEPERAGAVRQPLQPGADQHRPAQPLPRLHSRAWGAVRARRHDSGGIWPADRATRAPWTRFATVVDHRALVRAGGRKRARTSGLPWRCRRSSRSPLRDPPRTDRAGILDHCHRGGRLGLRWKRRHRNRDSHFRRHHRTGSHRILRVSGDLVGSNRWELYALGHDSTAVPCADLAVGGPGSLI